LRSRTCGCSTRCRRGPRELAQSVGELQALGEGQPGGEFDCRPRDRPDHHVANATQLSSTEAGAIYAFDDTSQEFQLRATYGMNDTIIAEIRDRRIRIGETAVGEAAEQRRPIQISRRQNDPSSTCARCHRPRRFPRSADRTTARCRPDRRRAGGTPQGTGRISKHTVDLLQTFAAQSVLAIQNARLFAEIEEKSRQLAMASEHKSQFVL